MIGRMTVLPFFNRMLRQAVYMGVGSGKQGGRAPPPGFSNMVQM